MTRIGVLCVHGIGNQPPGETAWSFAEMLAKSIPGALSPEPEAFEVKPVMASVTVPAPEDKDTTTIYVHEVHWSDLDDPSSLLKTLKFFWWGFSQWTVYQPPKPRLRGAIDETDVEGANVNVGRTRWELFVAASVFCGAGLLLFLLGRVPGLGGLIRQIFGGVQPLDMLVEYVGDVQLFTEDKACRLPLQERWGQVARVPIRRRAVQSMVGMASMGYDRWYVAAHSLGSVVAFNALMETESALPNYLTPATCDQLRQKSWMFVEKGSQPSGAMMPRRPAYVQKDEILSRRILFKDLRGFLTYGAPIDKFHTLWRPYAPVNCQKDVFRTDFEWINLYEDLDPIGAKLDFVDSAHAGGVKDRMPLNLGYRNSLLLGVAHCRHFGSHGKVNAVGRSVAQWISSGAPLRIERDRLLASFEQPQPVQWWLRAQLALLVSVMAMAAGFIGVRSVEGWDQPWTWGGVLAGAFLYLAGCVGLVLLVGVLNRLINGVPADGEKGACSSIPPADPAGKLV